MGRPHHITNPAVLGTLGVGIKRISDSSHDCLFWPRCSLWDLVLVFVLPIAKTASSNDSQMRRLWLQYKVIHVVFVYVLGKATSDLQGIPASVLPLMFIVCARLVIASPESMQASYNFWIQEELQAIRLLPLQDNATPRS
jgi:hypothetical protein